MHVSEAVVGTSEQVTIQEFANTISKVSQKMLRKLKSHAESVKRNATPHNGDRRGGEEDDSSCWLCSVLLLTSS